MNTVITFTPAQLVAFIGALFAFIASIGAGVAVIAKLITKIRKPELEQNRRIEALEKANKEREEEIKLLNIRLDAGDGQFKELEKANRVILKSLQALLKHSLGGDSAEALNDASRELDDYLLDK